MYSMFFYTFYMKKGQEHSNENKQICERGNVKK